jgi:hypothetical protein
MKFWHKSDKYEGKCIEKFEIAKTFPMKEIPFPAFGD